MSTLPTRGWDGVRELFAEQFEQHGSYFTYRRSQKGPAIQVSAEEQRAFIEDFDRNLRRANSIIYVGLTVVLGGVVLFTILTETDLSESAIFAGIGVVMIPYFLYYRWAWTKPARDLAGRTPIAGERPSEEVRRLQFKRMSYGQLAGAAIAGLALPFIVSSGEDVFSGWRRLWLAFSAAIVLLAAVQALRKWQFERESPYRGVAGRTFQSGEEPAEDSTPQIRGRLQNYLLLGGLALALAFVFLTPVGKQLAQHHDFWPIIMIGLGGWSLFTVIQGFRKGQIEPLARGFYDTYERDTQPKRFWASIVWNSVFAVLCFWIAFSMFRDAKIHSLQERCYPDGLYSPRDALAACDDWIGLQPANADAYFYRGLIYLDIGAFDQASSDFTRAHNSDPKDPWALANRGLAFAWKKDQSKAKADFEAVRAIDPSNPVMLRGEALLRKDAGDLRGAVDRLSASMKRDPDNLWALRLRSELYWELGEEEKSMQDDRRWVQLKRKLAAGSN